MTLHKFVTALIMGWIILAIVYRTNLWAFKWAKKEKEDFKHIDSSNNLMKKGWLVLKGYIALSFLYFGYIDLTNPGSLNNYGTGTVISMGLYIIYKDGTDFMELVQGTVSSLTPTTYLTELLPKNVSSFTEASKPIEGYILPMDVQETEADDYSGTEYVEIRRDTSTLFCGATRSGKSEGAKLLAYQLCKDWTADEPLLAYDRKDDWQRFFTNEDIEFDILSADSHETTVYWDMFGEIETERDIDRIARALFETDETDAEVTDEFFSTASRQVFAAVCKFLWRAFDERGATPSNKDLLRYVQEQDRDDVYADLSQHGDLRLAAQSMDPDAARTAVGVWANVTQEIQDIFVGAFRSPPEGVDPITLREYIDQPRGRALILSHPHRFGDEVERIYSYIIDDAIRRGMARDGGTVLLLDELPQLPQLDNFDELVNVGAGENVRTLVTIQSVSQMKDTYGEETALSLLAGMPTQILLRSGDPDTTGYYRQLIGQRYEAVVTKTRGGGLGGTSPQMSSGRSVTEEERHPFDEQELTTFGPGECVINRPDGWIHGQLLTLEDGGRELINKTVDR